MAESTIAASHISGFELPVYDSSVPLTSTEHLFNIMHYFKDQPVPDKIVRPVELAFDREDISAIGETLSEVLKRTDDDLRHVAKLCGALVVGHKWGLYPLEAEEIDPPFYLIPEGYRLVAEVDVIQDARTPLSPCSNPDPDPKDHPEAVFAGVGGLETIRKGIRAYFDTSGPSRLADLSHWQFVVGKHINASDNSDHAWLVDIEPRWLVNY